MSNEIENITPEPEVPVTLLVYLFNPDTGEFTGEYNAQHSPLEPGEFIEPTDSTRTAPPTVAANEIAIFADGAWTLKADFRGATLFSTETGRQVEFSELGVLPPEITDVPRPSACHFWQDGNWLLDVEKLKLNIWTDIKAERDRRTQNGGYKVGAKWYHSDTQSRIQQMGLVLLGANIPPATEWKTMDGSYVVMTPTIAGQIFGTAALSDIAIFKAAEAHRAAMSALPDPTGYDSSTGWPKAYGE